VSPGVSMQRQVGFFLQFKKKFESTLAPHRAIA
jgi:hypothetical protein